jgi:hypothetical protein
MTPKEKAIELVNKFYRIIPLDKMTIDFDLAKQCALIVADEVINTIMSVYQPITKEFWFEVKKEIEKL